MILNKLEVFINIRLEQSQNKNVDLDIKHEYFCDSNNCITYSKPKWP